MTARKRVDQKWENFCFSQVFSILKSQLEQLQQPPHRQFATPGPVMPIGYGKQIPRVYMVRSQHIFAEFSKNRSFRVSSCKPEYCPRDVRDLSGQKIVSPPVETAQHKQTMWTALCFLKLFLCRRPVATLGCPNLVLAPRVKPDFHSFQQRFNHLPGQISGCRGFSCRAKPLRIVSFQGLLEFSRRNQRRLYTIHSPVVLEHIYFAFPELPLKTVKVAEVHLKLSIRIFRFARKTNPQNPGGKRGSERRLQPLVSLSGCPVGHGPSSPQFGPNGRYFRMETPDPTG